VKDEFGLKALAELLQVFNLIRLYAFCRVTTVRHALVVDNTRERHKPYFVPCTPKPEGQISIFAIGWAVVRVESLQLIPN
jgi:hypothetical protein